MLVLIRYESPRRKIVILRLLSFLNQVSNCFYRSNWVLSLSTMSEMKEMSVVIRITLIIKEFVDILLGLVTEVERTVSLNRSNSFAWQV